MPERLFDLPILVAGRTTSTGRETLGARNFTSDNYRDSEEIHAVFGDKWLKIRNATLDYFAEDLEPAESVKGY